ncbi:hypothetical protein [Lactiplantibacillus plantarum]|jgi:hypothetical protein|uniref:hypothetical protein n=1 Tax=Lactiplantibacillus plantarum TaxID=1590 RepID=UPI00043797BF|nr:hypothetical protein [Lactiplantibacillus plantarum]EYR71605.1 hypothetical protein O209_06330 [Lactiplantibacillus plantarum WHE 92]KZV03950.1 hypothetical protein Nizo3893_0370 [Lactiplantibacillus plantarum]MCM2632235.1 hypothetical protein [Lactiplantibacillus plantarum]WCE43478.1 hypothetical protein PGB25_15285 [Lactiplantibacillus plantarum]
MCLWLLLAYYVFVMRRVDLITINPVVASLLGRIQYANLITPAPEIRIVKTTGHKYQSG